MTIKNAFFASVLTLAFVQSAFASLEIKVLNEDIGPVKGGNFLKAQKFLTQSEQKTYIRESTGKEVTKTVYHVDSKQPGSGLFGIPNKRTLVEEFIPLYDLRVKVIATTHKGAEVYSKYKSSEKGMDCLKDKSVPRLGLPGDVATVSLDASLDEIKSIKASIWATQYVFSGGYGYVFMSHFNGLQQVSEEVILHAKDFVPGVVPQIAFSFPREWVKDKDIEKPLLGARFYPNGFNSPVRYPARNSTAAIHGGYPGEVMIYPPVEKIFNRGDLVKNWKEEIGLTHEVGTILKGDAARKHVYSTFGFSIGKNGFLYGKDGEIIDLLSLKDDISYVAGHQLRKVYVNKISSEN